MREIDTDICVIGAGSGGLSVAAGAVQMGARVVLIERAEMGGDCLNFGCVPSKALIAAAKRAHHIGHSEAFGVAAATPKVDFPGVMAHVHDVIAGIAPTDSQERFEGLGCIVIRETAQFLDAHTVEAGDARIKAKRFVIATGSRAVAPPIPGLAETGYLTNETIFENRTLPQHLVVIGGGPIGMEMAQAHARLGARVTVLEAFKALGKDDPEVTAIALSVVRGEGVDIREGAKITGVSAREGGGAIVTLENGEALEASHLLVAAGRAPNLEDLALDAAGVAFDRKGVTVDARLRTSQHHIFAIGDAAGGLQFTHVAGWHAGVFIRNALFRLPAKAVSDAIPWVTFLDPEIAHVGMTEAEATKAGGTAKAIRWSFEENDRARAERRTEGLLKAVVDGRGRILGCSIVGMNAGELILPWVMAVNKGMKMGDLAGVIAPYPTLSEVSKRAAGAYFTPKLFSDRTRWVVRLLLKWLG